MLAKKKRTSRHTHQKSTTFNNTQYNNTMTFLANHDKILTKHKTKFNHMKVCKTYFSFLNSLICLVEEAETISKI